MLQQIVRRLAGIAFLLTWLLVAGAKGDEPKKPAEKKQPNPLQALQDAFKKGVTLTTVEPKDLPKEITDASAKHSPGAAIKKAEKQEIKHTMKYVAFDKPQVQRYQVIVVGKDEKLTRIQVGPDGKKLDVRAIKKEAAKEAPADNKKGIDIPEKAAKSVKAIKELYPDMVVIEITTEVYQDPSGVVDVLTYEIEFMSKGKKHEMVASPDGVIPHLWRPIGEKDLPKAVAETVAKEAPGGAFQSAAQYEIRAGLNFAPIAKSRVIYQLELEKDGKTSKLSLRADGSIIPAPVRPGGNRAYLGLSFQKDTTIVATVVKDGPADKAGVQVGDKILALGDAKVGAIPDLIKALASLKPGAEAKLRFQRGDKPMEVTVKLGSP